MKKLLLLGVALGLAMTTSASLVINNSWTVNQAIADGNPTGIALSQTYSGLDEGLGNAGINNVDVYLNITGGYNGDLYGYLVLQSLDGSTLTSILLNRVGRSTTDFGSSQSGFGSITLSSSGVTDIHGVTGDPSGGVYAADGRAIDPNGNFTGSTSTAGLDVLNGHSANGTWTLFLADMVTGDEATLVSWGLNVTVVPEPATWALIIFAALGGLFWLGVWFKYSRTNEN